MKNRLLTLLLIFLGLIWGGCEEESNPLMPQTLNFNDPIPFDEIGQGIVSFERISTDGSSGGVCIINALSRTTKVFSGIYNGPSISPDGSKIAFSNNSITNTFYDVYMMNIDGSNLINMSNMNGLDNYPSWAPDSKNILFINTAGPNYLYSVNIDNIQNKNILYQSSNSGPTTPASVYNSKNIVFSDGNDVKLFDSETRIITTACTPQIGGTYTPCWSPNGMNIAFVVGKIDCVGNECFAVGGIILIYDIQMNEIKTIYEWSCNKHIDYSGSNQLSVCWSPDGNKLLFNKSAEELESHIYLINIDGSGLKQITSEPGVCDRSVSWSK